MEKLSTLILSAALMAGMQIASAASAGADVQLSRQVSYSDLDLSRQAGVTALYQRLDRAAKAVCAPESGREIARLAAHKQCKSEAIARAVADIDQPLLTSYHRTKTSETETAVVASR